MRTLNKTTLYRLLMQVSWHQNSVAAAVVAVARSPWFVVAVCSVKTDVLAESEELCSAGEAGLPSAAL